MALTGSENCLLSLPKILGLISKHVVSTTEFVVTHCFLTDPGVWRHIFLLDSRSHTFVFKALLILFEIHFKDLSSCWSHYSIFCIQCLLKTFGILVWFWGQTLLLKLANLNPFLQDHRLFLWNGVGFFSIQLISLEELSSGDWLENIFGLSPLGPSSPLKTGWDWLASCLNWAIWAVNRLRCLKIVLYSSKNIPKK